MIILTQIQTLTAQTPGFDDDVQHVAGALVNQWVLLKIVLGLFFAIISIKKIKF